MEANSRSLKRVLIIFIVLFFFIKPNTLYCDDYGENDTTENKSSHEVLIRTAYNFGVLAKLDNLITGDFGINRFVPVIPELGVNVQLYKQWYLSLAFDYARVWGKKKIFPVGRHANIYASTFGIKYISNIDDPSSPYFLDRSRWWIGLDLGYYATQLCISSYAGIPNGLSSTSHDFGFNFSVGFDYFFSETFGAGFQTKIHYVNNSNHSIAFQSGGTTFSASGGDDYILVQFGPHLVMRF